MFNVDKISTNLYGLVGLRQPFNPTYAILDAPNQVSRSGYYATDNAYIKLEYLKDTQDYKDISESNFNLYLKRLQQSSAVGVCNRLFNGFDYLDRNLLFTNAHNKVNQETLVDGFVGYKIQVSRENDIAFLIKRVLLDFDTTGTLKLMLFNTSQAAPLQSKDIVITSKTQEIVLDWVIDNSNITYKGEYYLGYNKSNTTPVPFKRDYQNSSVMTNISKLNIEKMRVDGHAVETLFDLNSQEGLSEDIGINPDITVYEDFTDLIINNEMLFARAVNLEFCISVLRQQLNSLRTNSNERMAEKQSLRILAEIEGTGGDSSLKLVGLRSLLTGEIQQITKEVEKLRTGYFNNSIKVSTIY